jgi:hypothetical protein
MGRKAVHALFAVVVGLPLCLAASPARAATPPSCASWSGSMTFSPPLPGPGDPTKVQPTVTATQAISGCVGLGVTSGTAVFTGGSLSPYNCDALLTPGSTVSIANETTGATVITWNTGQTSTLSGHFPEGDSVTAGLFAGAFISVGNSYQGRPNFCSGPEPTETLTSNQPLTIELPAGSTSCRSPRSCDTTRAASATATAPGLTVHVTGTPAVGVGTVQLKIAPGSLPCPNVTSVGLVADLTDTGFAPTDRLSVTATLPLTSSTSPELVCFHSTSKAGSAFLLNCTRVRNVAPCVTSSSQVGSNEVIKFVVPGRDPRFYIVVPTGREVWASQFPTARIGKAYSAHLQTRGGKAPVHWKIASGKLPNGCTLNADTGTITGTPSAKGTFNPVVQATDSAKPPQTAKLSLPITVT